MSFYGFKIWHRRLHGLYRARRRCSRGRFAPLIPVGREPDIPFTRPWAAMPAPNKPSRENVLCGTILPENHILSQIKRLSGTNFLSYESSIVFPKKSKAGMQLCGHHPPRELGHYSRRHLLISRLRTSFRGVMDGREEEGLKRRKKLEDVDAAEESEASRLSIQARYFMASGDPRSMR